MSIIKLGEAHEIRLEDPATCIPEVSAEVLENFRKTASSLKRIAPKAEDFLYFSAVMMHAAEASALNDDGTIRLTASGKPVEVGWDTSGNTCRWVSNDPSIKPYKNSNGDIFPEQELLNAYKKWRTKPLCIDHKSNSVDHVRGFIVDTVYDRNLKRVIALCALDKAGFPQLARQISTGVSNCVSMGTAVGRAICTDCARVARTEADFCNHMKNKSGYGEINCDLSPLELSIVVNGADPKANIKHIIAAANTMNTYLENKAAQLEKLAETYSGTIHRHNGETGSPVDDSQTIEIKGANLKELEEDFHRGMQTLENLKNSQENTNSSASNQSSGTVAMDEGSPTDSELSLQGPPARFASANVEADAFTELQAVTAAIEAKLTLMKRSLDKLAKTSTNKIQEEHMSGNNINKQGYFQGAGGVNEPTPGQVKYPKDALNEQLREHEDKQMVGQSPFPEVGPVDGMHPSPASADPSAELERKKMLARAELEDRAMKRNAVLELAKKALEKKSYMLGGGGVNEPTPGKPKYPKDKLNEELRDYEDKQMVGQPPFPGVGAVDGLHPSPASSNVKDELKRKEMLARAGLKAKFVKAFSENGALNKAKSAWQVQLGDKLILTASVDELSAGNTELLFDNIATKEFGVSLIEKVKSSGVEAVNKLMKKAQDAGAPPPPPVDAAPPAGDAPPVADEGKSGDPKETAIELAKKNVEISGDLQEAVRALTGEQAEMGGAGEAGAPAMADDGSSEKFSSTALNAIRGSLNGALMQAMKESIAELKEHKSELDMIVGICNEGKENSAGLGPVVEDAFNENKSAIADGFKLMDAFLKYARGTAAIVKRAEMDAELQALAEGESMSETKDSQSADGGDLMGLINDTNADLDAVKEMSEKDDGLEGLDDLGDLGLDLKEVDDADASVTSESTPADDNDVTFEAGESVPPELAGKKLTMASYNTKEGRNALRAKLAADATGKEENGEITDMSKQKFSDMLDAADKLTDGQTKLDTKPSDNLGLVETLPEVNKAMMELAKAPPNVRKQAEVLQNLIASGKVNRNDIDALVANGLDSEAASYWKKYYGEVDGGSEFASELVKAHVKAQIEKELGQFKVKMARAYELAYDMADRGLCHHERSAISSQVDEIMKFNDESFDSLKRVVARHAPIMRKEAGRIPQVGMRSDNDGAAPAVADENPYAELSSMFGTRKGAF